MINLELAKKLHDLGVEAEYHDGNYIYRKFRHGYRLHLIADWTEERVWDDDLPAPRLDQMLKEIEKSGFYWEIQNSKFSLFIVIYRIEPWVKRKLFYSEENNVEDAVAKALLWILEEGLSLNE